MTQHELIMFVALLTAFIYLGIWVYVVCRLFQCIFFEKKTKYIKQWYHKLFDCPTFWKSIWNTYTKNKPFYRCPECNKAMHCYWDGNDTNKGIDFCNKCASEHNLNNRINFLRFLKQK